MSRLLTKLSAPELDYWREEASAVVLEPDVWLRTPHELLGGREPLELILSGKQDEQRVQDLLDRLKHGIFT